MLIGLLQSSATHFIVAYAYGTGEKDLTLLAMISCSINLSERTTRAKRTDNRPRTHQRTTYSVQSKAVCRATFKFMHMYVQTWLSIICNDYCTNYKFI